MYSKAVDHYPHALEFVPECYKIQKMCNKDVDIQPPTIQFVPECYKTQKICYKAVQQKTQEICGIVFLYLFLIVYCPGKYITQRMCDEAVDDSLAAPKLIPVGWFQIK